MVSDRDQVILRNLQFAYGQRKQINIVMDDVSLTIDRGKIAVLVGPNGVGKSTLLKVLGGSLTPQRGCISVFGDAPEDAKIGIVWQETYASLFPWLTALENAALPLRLTGKSRLQRRQQILKISDELGSAVPLNRYPYELSGGEQQKVCILRALASQCDLLLLDEPTANLSFDSATDLLLHLQRVQKQTRLTIVIVSHSLEFSTFIADVIIPLQKTPVKVNNNDIVEVSCPHSRPRPLAWMYESEFRDQVQILKRSINGGA
jgi:NitT/TauT family transport system ATP-binding protein